jgi:glycosyltransferase involved in cell wall biosynthesis
MLNCFVLPSQSEGTSCTLQEAMACGLPIVATAVGGTPALVVNEMTGLLTQPGDVDGMTHAIWRYMSQAHLADAHASAARELALSTFGVDSMTRQYYALFEGD